MSEVESQKSEMNQTEVAKTISLESMKRVHDYYVMTLQILTQKCQFFHEEFQGANDLVAFYKAMIKAQRENIEALEPKKEEKQDGQEGTH
jgi:hypothetical protein